MFIEIDHSIDGFGCLFLPSVFPQQISQSQQIQGNKWRAEHAANTAVRDSVSAAALRVCFLCECLPTYFRFNWNYPLITTKCLAEWVIVRI